MSQLPPPPHWRDKNLLFLFALILFGASGIAAAVMTGRRLANGDYLTAAILLGGIASCGSLALVVARIMFSASSLHATSSAVGTTLRPDRTLVSFGMSAIAPMLFSAMLYLVYAPSGRVDLPEPMGQASALRNQLYAGLMVGFGGISLAALIFGKPRFALTLAADGFSLPGLSSTEGIWADVVDITDQSANKQDRHPTVFVMRDGKPLVLKNTSGFAPSGPALYWMIRHYWLHPENRDELTDGRALERLRGQQFVPE